MATQWEFEDFVLPASEPNRAAYKANNYTLVGTARNEIFAEYKTVIMNVLKTWFKEGWEPVTPIGPDCIVIETREKRTFFGVDTYIYPKEVRIQMRRLKK